MPFHHHCIKTQTMTSRFPQRQKPSSKQDTTPYPVHANRNGFMTFRWVLKNRVRFIKAPTLPCLPKLFVGSFSTTKQASVELEGRPVPRPLFTTYQKRPVLEHQVHQNYCQGSRSMTSHQLRAFQKKWLVQFHLRGNALLELLVITSMITSPWSAGATRAKPMNSKESVFSE